jgi:rubredoxin-NAD+ reductase
MNKIIIIGTGLAGYTLARELRKRDQQAELLLITHDDGSSYSKPMLSNALDKGKTADTLVMADAEKMATDLNADIWTRTTVTEIDADKRQIKCDRGTVDYQHLVLAIGASPIKIPFAGDAADQILSVNSLEDYRVFRQALEKARRVLIIGAGLIGCEFANDLSTTAGTIDIVDLAPQPLGRLLPEQAAHELQSKLTAAGINWHLNNAVSAVHHADNALSVELKDGSQIETDVVLSAIGLRANTGMAAAAGLDTERGIKVDRYLQTSQQDIHALGDCAQVDDLHLPFVMPLMNAARALAATLSGDKTSVSYPAMPVVVKTPLYPIVVCPPPRPVDGAWHEEVTDQGIRAWFKDDNGNSLGFALTGDLVKERMAMSKEIPDWLG